MVAASGYREQGRGPQDPSIAPRPVGGMGIEQGRRGLRGTHVLLLLAFACQTRL